MTLPLTCIHVTCNIQCNTCMCIIYSYIMYVYVLLFTCFCAAAYYVLSLCINLIYKITLLFKVLFHFYFYVLRIIQNYYNMTSFHITITALVQAGDILVLIGIYLSCYLLPSQEFFSFPLFLKMSLLFFSSLVFFSLSSP